ncbi:MAG: hypothetical protein RIS58_1262, partial [Actinomycetota bacterium]
DQLSTSHVAMTDQRDRLRDRMATVEASREYRLAQRLLRLFPFLGN